MKPTFLLRQRARERPDMRAIFLPENQISPAFGASNPPSKCNKVLLPAPEAPRNATKSPRRICKFTPRKTSSDRRPMMYVLCTSRASINAPFASGGADELAGCASAPAGSFMAQGLHRFEAAGRPGWDQPGQHANDQRAAADDCNVTRTDQG